MNGSSVEHNFPMNLDYSLVVILSAASAILMCVFSGLGLLFSKFIYPTAGLREINLTNDLVNILIGLPLFFVSLIFIRKGRLLGILLLPGALIYVIYNFIGYALGRPWNWLSIAYTGLVLLSALSLGLLLQGIDHKAVKERIEERVSRKLSGWVLVIFGLAFIALAVSTISTGIQEGTIPPLGENAVSVADIVVSLGWLAGGIFLLREKPLGYTFGLGLLIAASSLFVGLILFFFFAPLFSDRAFDWSEVIAILVMGLICFIPTGIYWRGIVRSEMTV